MHLNQNEDVVALFAKLLTEGGVHLKDYFSHLTRSNKPGTVKDHLYDFECILLKFYLIQKKAFNQFSLHDVRIICSSLY